MSAKVTGRGRSGRIVQLKLFSATVGIWLLGIGSAQAGQSTFRIYGADQGLVNVTGSCMLQDHAGDILICTDQGIFTYDGRHFVNLGTQQGLREGGLVYGLTLTATGRMAVEYNGEVRVSNRATDPVHPPSSLRFTAVPHPGVSLNTDKPRRMAPWRDGLVVLNGTTTVRVVVPAQGPPHVETMGYDSAEEALLNKASAVFSVHDHLWEVFSDGRLCAAEPGAVRCYVATDRSAIGPWFDVVAGSGDAVIARSVLSGLAPAF